MRQFLIVFVFIVALVSAVDAFFIEPYRVEVTHSTEFPRGWTNH